MTNFKSYILSATRIRIRVLMLAVITFITAGNLLAQTQPSPYDGYAEEVFMDMEFEANLATPAVEDALKSDVKRYVKSVAEANKKDLKIDLMRNGEVMIVTFPTDDLFLPNDTLLMPSATRHLNKILPLIKDPMMFKLVYAVHTDDTGSDSYCEHLATARVNSIYDWLLESIEKGSIDEDLVIIPYSMASSDPMTDNDTREHRKINRRLEFYLVPGPKMIDKAMKKTLVPSRK